MKLKVLVIAILFCWPMANALEAQSLPPLHAQLLHGAPPVTIPPPLPFLTPDAALVQFEERARKQAAELVQLADVTVVRAELPGTSQKGEFELRRYYTSPRTLRYSPVNFTGDSFVKTNVIARVLQSEIEHVEKDRANSTAINSENYKFKHKTTEALNDTLAYVYEVKPKKKKVGLFKGRIWLDATNGSLLRTEGSAVKSPSWFIKKVEFVQEYAQVGAYTFPKHLRSISKVRLFGRAIVDIFHKDYTPVVADQVQTPAASASGGR